VKSTAFLVLVILVAILPFGRRGLVTQAHGQSTNSTISRTAEYSQELALVVELAKKHFNVDQISIGGGTARALLQHVYLGQPFLFRDFDLVLSADQKVTAETARAFGLELERRGLGQFSAENLRSRPRYNPEISDFQLARKYNAGFGFFLVSPGNTEYDISLYHSNKDLALNGIMDVDRFQIVLTKDVTLLDLIQDPELLKKQLIDPENAFSKVMKNQIPMVARWGEVIKDPAMVSIRVVRTLAKFNGLPMDGITKARLASYVQGDREGNPLQIARNFLKLLEDPNWLAEYKQLVEIGLFTHHLKSFKVAASAPRLETLQTLEEKVLAIFQKASIDDSLRFLKLLAPLEPELLEKVLPALIRSKRLKVGYFSGEFAPFHHGHEGVVSTALQNKAVDLVFVLPTPFVTNGPKTKVFSAQEWSERIQFSTTALSSYSQAWVWPQAFTDKTGLRRLDASISSLEDFLKPSRPLTHIMGMDSFHRAVYRELLVTDPRPRVIVTRPGVPVPKEVQDPSVRVLENVYRSPVSATRILHEIAVSGHSVDLRPEVSELVKVTPRYQDMIAKSIEVQRQTEAAIPAVESYKGKTLVWYVLENHAGLLAMEFPRFSQKHKKILENLLALEPKEVVVAMIDKEYDQSRVRNQWVQATSSMPKVRIEGDRLPQVGPRRIDVIHSGKANENLKRSVFERSLNGIGGLIFYETPDQPLSPLLRALRSTKVIEIQPSISRLTCSKVYRAM
jgi:nicotinic acid mononucleotide adenylyltransferase